jgi:hypothetical protein
MSHSLFFLKKEFLYSNSISSFLKIFISPAFFKFKASTSITRSFISPPKQPAFPLIAPPISPGRPPAHSKPEKNPFYKAFLKLHLLKKLAPIFST